MRKKRLFNLTLVDTAAVVGDPDKIDTSAFDLDSDRARRSIDRVFKKLFDDRRGTLYNLSGGNPVDRFCVKDVDHFVASLFVN